MSYKSKTFHNVIQDFIYDSLSPAEKRDYEKVIAEQVTIDTAEVAVDQLSTKTATESVDVTGNEDQENIPPQGEPIQSETLLDPIVEVTEEVSGPEVDTAQSTVEPTPTPTPSKGGKKGR